MANLLENKVYNTYPSVIHLNGHNIDDVNINQFKCADAFTEVSRITDCTFITWRSKYFNIISSNQAEKLRRINDSDFIFPRAEYQFRSMKVPFFVLGTDIEHWNLSLKYSLIYSIINQIKTKYIIGVDNIDTKFIRDPQFIIDEFVQLDHPIIFSAEKHYSPNQPSTYRFLKSFEDEVGNNHIWRYLNSGMFVAQTVYFKDLLLRYINNNVKSNNDQAIMHYLFKSMYPIIGLDYECSMFQNLNRVTEQEVVL